MLPQPLEATGHRKPGLEAHNVDKHRRGSEMPARDANANRSYFGPGGLLKGGGSGRHKTSLDMNVRPTGQAGRFQRARTRRK